MSKTQISEDSLSTPFFVLLLCMPGFKLVKIDLQKFSSVAKKNTRQRQKIFGFAIYFMKNVISFN